MPRKKQEEKTKIVNITRIEKLVGKTYHTLIKWKSNYDFPMFKEGGQWVMFKEDYQDWQKKIAESK